MGETNGPWGFFLFCFFLLQGFQLGIFSRDEVGKNRSEVEGMNVDSMGWVSEIWVGVPQRSHLCNR